MERSYVISCWILDFFNFIPILLLVIKVKLQPHRLIYHIYMVLFIWLFLRLRGIHQKH